VQNGERRKYLFIYQGRCTLLDDKTVPVIIWLLNHSDSYISDARYSVDLVNLASQNAIRRNCYISKSDTVVLEANFMYCIIRNDFRR
jgi:hypothetical protein